MTQIPLWLQWAQQLQAIAQTGLTFCQDPFDRERYQQIEAIAAEMLSQYSDVPLTRVQHFFAGEQGYATPKLDVRAAVFVDDRILLVREVEDGLWTLPGGWCDVGEAPSVAVAREVKEEAGYEVRATKLAYLADRNAHPHPPYPFHVYKLFFVCELLGGAASTSIETSATGFFAAGALPPLSLMRVTPAQIQRLFVHHAHPDLPTDFD